MVAMEACASSHFWARAIAELGHDVRLVSPAYVKPFVNRQKNDMVDAESICEAAQRPTMRFVAVKSEAKQASAVIFRTRDLWSGNERRLSTRYAAIWASSALSLRKARLMWTGLLRRSKILRRQSRKRLGPACSGLSKCCEASRLKPRRDAEIAARAKRDEASRRPMTIPGIGPLIAAALEALAPPPETFKSGRDFATWIGLTPVQESTGGKQRLGRTSRMGERTLRRLLIIACSGVVRWAKREGARPNAWLSGMLARKPAMLVIVALANKTARIAWAVVTRGEDYRAPSTAAAA
jgi:transposase